jgi:catechol 2,3-dioxygenase-like lactoylglutathione lyase family enzyme
MACRITELVLDCRDPELLAAFWCKVLDWEVIDRVGDDVEIGPPGVGFGGLQPTLVFERNGEPKLQKLRLHIDVSPTDQDPPEELERLLALGATRADIGQGDVAWTVLADPEGNEFCLLRRLQQPADAVDA